MFQIVVIHSTEFRQHIAGDNGAVALPSSSIVKVRYYKIDRIIVLYE